MGTIGALPNAYRSSRSSVGMPWVTLRVTGLRRAAYSKRKQSVQNCIPTRSMGTIGALPNAYRSSRSSVGMPWVTLRVTNLRHAAYSKRTRSALNGIPTRSVGTIVKKCTVAPAVNSRRRRSWAGSALVWRIHKGSIPVHGPSCVARQSADAGRCCFRYYPTAPARFRR
ncbi:hypothetical protein PSCFBP2116_05434 [Pseudomonas syringae]|uniref:DUF1534 domain-containing protein n=1 Tax=Pseudomonas syringae TaxID=317 RepID=A0A2K4WMR3_PSESX|nr:hypothetical protein CFBP3840_00118 [Pseudomonas syringae]SPD84909.1 hypothetical protein PSCFBP2116_05434 [Pseudomonas syringae]